MKFKFRVIDRKKDRVVLTSNSFQEVADYVNKRCKNMLDKRFIIIRTVV